MASKSLSLRCRGRGIPTKTFCNISSDMTYTGLQTVVEKEYGVQVTLLHGFPPRELALKLSGTSPIGSVVSDMDTITIVKHSARTMENVTTEKKTHMDSQLFEAKHQFQDVSSQPTPTKVIKAEDSAIRRADQSIMTRLQPKYSEVSADSSRDLPDTFCDTMFAVKRRNSTSESHNQLATLYNVPQFLSFSGSFNDAKSLAIEKKMWLLVNIQKKNDFASLSLNRDIWNNKLMQETIQASFIFIQRDSRSSDGMRYLSIYPVDKNQLPHVGILDSITGQLLLTFKKTQLKTATEAVSVLVDFVTSGSKFTHKMSPRSLKNRHKMSHSMVSNSMYNDNIESKSISSVQLIDDYETSSECFVTRIQTSRGFVWPMSIPVDYTVGELSLKVETLYGVPSQDQEWSFEHQNDVKELVAHDQLAEIGFSSGDILYLTILNDYSDEELENEIGDDQQQQSNNVDLLHLKEAYAHLRRTRRRNARVSLSKLQLVFERNNDTETNNTINEVSDVREEKIDQEILPIEPIIGVYDWCVGSIERNTPFGNSPDSTCPVYTMAHWANETQLNSEPFSSLVLHAGIPSACLVGRYLNNTEFPLTSNKFVSPEEVFYQENPDEKALLDCRVLSWKAELSEIKVLSRLKNPLMINLSGSSIGVDAIFPELFMETMRGIMCFAESSVKPRQSNEQKVRYLSLGKTGLRSEHTQIIASLLCAERGLVCPIEELSLRENFLRSSGIKHLSLALSYEKSPHSSLRVLNLGKVSSFNGSSGIQAFKSLCNLTRPSQNTKNGNKKLETLILDQNGLGEYHMKILGLAVSKGARIMRIDLSFNRIGPVGAKELSQFALGTSESCLRHLTLAHCGLGDKGIIELLPAIRVANNLSHLDISENYITSVGIHKLSKCLSRRNSRNSSPLQLSVAFNTIGVQGIVALSVPIQLGVILGLNLECCKIGKVGAIELSKAIRNVSKTTFSNISDVNLKNKTHNDSYSIRRERISKEKRMSIGAEWLLDEELASGIVPLTLTARMIISTWRNQKRAKYDIKSTQPLLRGRYPITDLNLKGNLIGFDGCNAISAALTSETGCSLTRLNIEKNHIGNNGAVSLLDAISQNNKRRKLMQTNRNRNDSLYINDNLVSLQLTTNDVISTWPLPLGFDPILEDDHSLAHLNDTSIVHPPLRLRQLISFEPIDISIRLALCSVVDQMARSKEESIDFEARRQQYVVGRDELQLIFDFLRIPKYRIISFV